MLFRSIPNGDGKLKPGMYARINLTVEEHENALVIPKTAVIDYTSQRGVWVPNDNDRAMFVPLKLEKVATAVSTKGMFYDSENAVERLVFPDWGPKTFRGVPFTLVDPQGQRVPNVVLLHGPHGTLPPKMPKSVSLSVGSAIKALHLLGGVAGWAFPGGGKGSTSMIVRLVYADGTTEDHPLQNGAHVADYIKRIDVPESEFAFDLDGRQLRYLRIEPKRPEPVAAIELVKGDDATAPVVMALTAEMP